MAISKRHRILVATDGSPSAQAALATAVRFPRPHRRGRTVWSLAPSCRARDGIARRAAIHFAPAVIASEPMRAELIGLNKQRLEQAQEAIDAACARLRRQGWPAKGDVRTGAPLAGLLCAGDDHRADVLVLERAISGLERTLLGSVANGALNASRVPVLLVR